jgi:hypothetical protein
MLDINDLNPLGHVFFPSLVPMLVERFTFQTFPIKAEDFDETKGVSFSNGYLEGQHIENITVYSDGIKIETRSSTKDGRRILIDTLEWLTNVGLSFSETMIVRWGFVSQLTFYSDVDLVALHPALSKASERVSAAVSQRLGVERNFAPQGFALSFDPVDAQIPMANFTIERRGRVPYADGKYYSGAPLETDMHIEVLQEFEGNVMQFRLHR